MLGPDHPDTLTHRFNTAGWQVAAGDHAEAVAVLERLLVDSVALSEVLPVLRRAGVDLDLMVSDPLAYWEREYARAVAESGRDDRVVGYIQARLAQLRAEHGA